MNNKKTLAFAARRVIIALVVAKSATGIGVPFSREAQHASNFLEHCVFFCARILPSVVVMVGRTESLRVRRFLVTVTPIRSTCHPKIGVLLWRGFNPNHKETANV